MASDAQRTPLGISGGASGSPRIESGHELREIARRAAALAHDLWGRGPERCEAHWVGREMLVTLFYGGLTPAELSLEQAGAVAEVERSRDNFRRTLEPHLCDIVQEVTGCSVYAALGASRLVPDVTIEVFVLGPDEPAADSLAGRIRAANRMSDAMRQEAETEAQAASAVRGESSQARRQARQIRAESQARRARRDDGDEPRE